MYSIVHERIQEFKKRYPGTVAWRLKAHSRVIERHLNPGEEVIYAFPGQKSHEWYNIFTTCIVVITSKRILIGIKRVLFGYFMTSITPDMFNDLKVFSNLLWGTVEIDTIKEAIFISNVSKKALDEIETAISEYMMAEKKKYAQRTTEVEGGAFRS